MGSSNSAGGGGGGGGGRGSSFLTGHSECLKATYESDEKCYRDG